MTTIFAPKKLSELSADVLNFRGTGISGVALPAVLGIPTTTNIDYELTEDRLILGAYAILSGHSFGDKMTVQVIDKNNVLGYGANTVLNQFVTDWYVDPSVATQRGMEAPYPAKVFQGLFLRLKYTNTGLAPVAVYINALFHKVLA